MAEGNIAKRKSKEGEVTGGNQGEGEEETCQSFLPASTLWEGLFREEQLQF